MEAERGTPTPENLTLETVMALSKQMEYFALVELVDKAFRESLKQAKTT